MVVKYGALAVLKCLKYSIGISWKKRMHLRPSTPNCMVYGELGVLPLQVAIAKRIIGYWFRLLSKHHSVYSYCIYRMALTLFSNDLYTGQVGLGVGSWPSNRATEGLNPK